MAKKVSLNLWQLALAAIVVSALGSLSAMQASKKQRKTYKTLRQAPWAPPAWVFAPAWTINNFFILMALMELVNAKPDPRRSSLLWLQGGIWLIFFTFNYAYFKKKSPLLAATLTMADNGLAVSSLIVALSYRSRLAWQYLPLSIWTSFASTLAVYQALHNQDPVFNTKPALEYFN